MKPDRIRNWPSRDLLKIPGLSVARVSQIKAAFGKG
jgi:hypothetical protein